MTGPHHRLRGLTAAPMAAATGGDDPGGPRERGAADQATRSASFPAATHDVTIVFPDGTGHVAAPLAARRTDPDLAGTGGDQVRVVDLAPPAGSTGRAGLIPHGTAPEASPGGLSTGA